MSACTQNPALTRRSALALAGLALVGAALAPALAQVGDLPEGYVLPAGSTVEPSAPTAVAGDRVEGEFYAFEIPEHWRGRVAVEVEGASAWVRPLCCPQAQLVSVHVRDAAREPFPQAGNPDHSYVYGVDNGRGQYVYVDAYNLPMWMSDGLWEGLYAPRWGVEDPEAAAAELVDLSTGGAATLEQARADFSSVFGASYDFCREAFLPGLEVAMDEPWAKLAALRASGWESETVASLAQSARAELADASGGLDWLFELSQDPRVAGWAEAGMPVASFLVRVAAPLLAASDLTSLEATCAGSISAEGHGSFRYEVVYSCWDPWLASAGDFEAVTCDRTGLSSVLSSLDEDELSLTDLASVEAAVAARVEALLSARGFLGASASVWWVYDLASGASVSGHTSLVGAPATRVETGCYSFDVPDYWEGRVEIRVSGEAAYVSPLGRPGPDLVWITVRDAADPMPSGGDIMQWLCLASLPVPGGRVAWMSGANFGYAVGSGAWEGGVEGWPAYDEALARELVDLATGGVLTLEDARADWRTASNAVYAYYVDEVVPRLVAAGC